MMNTSKCKIRSHWLLAVLLVFGSGSVFGVDQAIPFSDHFDTTSLGAGWSKAGEGDSVVSTAAKLEGTYGVTIVTNALTLNMDATQNDGTNVWVLFYAKPAPYDDSGGEPTIAGDVTAAFYVNTDGDLVAYSNNTWRTLGNVGANQWLGFAVHLDYDNDSWDLYVNTSGSYLDKLTRLNTEPLEPQTGHGNTSLDKVVFDTDLQAYIDAVGVTAGYANSGANLGIARLRADVRESFFIPGYNYTYEDDNTLDARLGDDLLRALENEDKLYVHGASGFTEYTISGGAWGDPGGGFEQISRMTGLVLDRDAGTDYYAFFPYDALTAIPVAGNPGNPQITGKDDVETGGYNMLHWPLETDGIANHGDNGFKLPEADGDVLYIFGDSGLTILRYSTQNEVAGWRERRNLSNKNLSQGDMFWYYKATDGVGNWDL